MERSLLEPAQLRAAGIAACALGEDEDALSMCQHLIGGAGESLTCAPAVGAVDEDGAGKGHEPAEEGDGLEARFGGDGAVGREDAGEEEDVEFGLVVADDDGGTGGREVVFAGEDAEGDAGGVAH